MSLLVHSRSGRDLSRLVSGPGQLFVAGFVGLMFLASFGDMLEPVLMSELAFDLLASELGLEAILMSLPSWTLLELLLAGLALSIGWPMIVARRHARVPALFPVDPRRDDKVPI